MSYWKHCVYATGIYRARNKYIAMQWRDGNRAKSEAFDNYTVPRH